MQPLILAMALYSSVAQINAQDFAAFRFTQQTPAVTGPSKEPNSECPPPLSVMIFLRRQICVHGCFAEKLAVANKLLEQQGLVEASTARSAATYGLSSWANQSARARHGNRY